MVQKFIIPFLNDEFCIFRGSNATMLKPIKYHLSSPLVPMGDIEVFQPLPNQWVDQIDPFLLLHHWKDVLPGNQHQKDIGVGPHPHCGFMPVTFVLKGAVHHRDSLGNNSVVNEGGLQWINSGKGIVHSERPEKLLAEQGGDFEIIQLWINLPEALKQKAPYYLARHAHEVPEVKSLDLKTSVFVLAGNYESKVGVKVAEIDLQILRVDLKKGGTFSTAFSEKYNTFIYQLRGHTQINEMVFKNDHEMIWFENQSGIIEVKAVEDAQLILFAGMPFNEPVVSHGPFVLNRQEEVFRAIKAYQIGKMGVLIEEFN